jgi:hypothetical protein
MTGAPIHPTREPVQTLVPVHQLRDLLAGARIRQLRGDLPAALDLVENLLRTAEQSQVDTATVRTAKQMRAELLHELGHTTDADQQATALYQECLASLPNRHPATTRTAVLLAAIRHQQGDLDTATTATTCRPTGRHPLGRADNTARGDGPDDQP